jgi:uncharacterized protein (TIGR02246 family)
MKKLFTFLSLVLVAFFAFSCQQAEEVSEEPIVDARTAIENASSLYKEFDSASNSNDAVRLADVFTYEAIRIPANGPLITGKDNILRDFQAFYDEFTEEAKIEVLDAHMFGDMISARGTWASIITPKDGGESRNINGNWVSILKKQPDDSWNIMWDIWTLEQLVDPFEEK